jgi:adenylate cyclase
LSESALFRAILGARKALGDDAATQQIIATKQRRGYRFVASLVELADASPSYPYITVPPTENPGRDRGLARFNTDLTRDASYIPSGSLQAYDSFLHGLESLRGFTRQANAQAQEIFANAIALDRRFAPGYAGLGWTYWMQWANQWNHERDTLERAGAMAREAIRLDPSAAMVHRLLAWVQLWQKHYEQAIDASDRAVTLDPNGADGYAALADILICAGQPIDGLRCIERAMRLNPLYPPWYLFELGLAQRFAGQLDQALITQQRVCTRAPEFLNAHLELAVIFAELGRDTEARAQVAAILRFNAHISLANLEKQLPFRDQAILASSLAALKKSGLS